MAWVVVAILVLVVVAVLAWAFRNTKKYGMCYPRRECGFKDCDLEEIDEKTLTPSALAAYKKAASPPRRLPKRYLTNSDFRSGTYRLRQESLSPEEAKNGVELVLKEDIFFNPVSTEEKNRTDKPANGWFAVISIENTTVPVVLNRRGKEISVASTYLDALTFKVFANIAVATSPFPNFISAVFTYTDPANPFVPPAYETPSGPIWDMNGGNGRTPHMHYVGSEAELYLYNMNLEGNEVFSISLSSLNKFTARNVSIYPYKGPVKLFGQTRPIENLISFTNLLIAVLPPSLPNYNDTIGLLNALLAELEADNPTNEIYTQVPNTQGGLNLQAGPSTLLFRYVGQTRFIPTPNGNVSYLDIVKAATGTHESRNLNLFNISVNCTKVKMSEEVLIGYGTAPPAFVTPDPLQFPLAALASPIQPFSPIQPGRVGLLVQALFWENLFDGPFGMPNIAVRATIALMYIMQGIPQFNGIGNTYVSDEMFNAIVINTMLNPNGPSPVDFSSGTLNTYIQPITGRLGSGDWARGVTGIRLQGCDNAYLHNCLFKDFSSVGDVGIDLIEEKKKGNASDVLQLSAYGDAELAAAQLPWLGNNVVGLSIQGSNNVTAINICSEKLRSTNGNVYGVELYDNSANTISLTKIRSKQLSVGNHGLNTVINPTQKSLSLVVLGPNEAIVSQNNSASIASASF